MKSILLSAILACLALTARAVPITGAISLAGGYTVNTGDLNTATAFSSFSGVMSTGAVGPVFTAIPVFVPFSVLMSPFGFTGFSPVTPLWTWTSGLNTIDFSLTSLSSVSNVPTNSLTIVGTGFYTATGYDPTPATYILTANQANGTYSFSSSNAAVVPDGGSTALILLSGLASLGIFGRFAQSCRLI